jgi:hypothetical protein
MQTVSRFESNLLRLLHYFLGREPAERALPLLEDRRPGPPCLSRAAVRLVQDALGKGCVHQLARRGGWRQDRFLRGDRVAEGRLWERSPPAELGLTFSQNAMAFLVWITAHQPGDDGLPPGEWTVGDLLMLHFVHEGLRDSAPSLGAPDLRLRPPFVSHGLCRLAFPEDFGNAPAEASPDFDPWIASAGACVLEALQPFLAERWFQTEAGKGTITDGRKMRELGAAQERVLTPFLNAVERAGRLDLAGFLLAAAARLLGPGADASLWIGALEISGVRLADRTAAYDAALAFVRQVERLQTWDRRARTVGYLDEGYAAAQLWKADWERFEGDALADRARSIIRNLDPLRRT